MVEFSLANSMHAFPFPPSISRGMIVSAMRGFTL